MVKKKVKLKQKKELKDVFVKFLQVIKIMYVRLEYV